MKPIKLIISAFGPYADTMPPIRFDEFDENGLFLIAGDTGAGKTTIFDAICYALYGKTSGSYRNTSNLRSEYAKDDVESFVDFYFSHQGKNYHIIRRPSYERKNLRREGTVQVKESVELHCNDEPPIEGITKVDAAVKELLHIDDKQFKQIAMIAQGEFWNLLNAKTDTRTEILRTIFATDGYKDIANKLKNRSSESYKIKVNTENSVIQYFSDINVCEDSRYFDELQDMKNKAVDSKSTWNIEDFMNLIINVIEEDKIIYSKQEVLLKKEEESLDNKKSKLTTLNNRMTEALNTKTAMDKNNKELAEVEEILKEAKISLEECSKHETRAAELIKLAEKIDEDKEKYEQRDSLKREIEELKNMADSLIKFEEKLKGDEEALARNIVDYEGIIKELQDKPQELIKLENLAEKLADLKDKINNIIEVKLPTHKDSCKKLLDAQVLFECKRTEYDKVVVQRQDMERIIEGCRAGLLAKNLQDGEACPVCGSIHHPKLAILPQDSVSEEEFKVLKKAEDDLKIEKDNALIDAEKIKHSCDIFEEQLRVDMLDCVDNQYEDFETLCEQIVLADKKLDEDISNNNKQYIEAKKSCEKLRKTQDKLAKARGEETTTLKKAQEEYQSTKQKNETELTQKTAIFSTLSKLEYETWVQAVTHRDDFNAEAKGIIKKIETAKENVDKYQKRVTELNATIETLQKTYDKQTENIEDNAKEVIEQLELEVAKADEIVEHLREQLNEVKNRIAINEDRYGKIDAQKDYLTKIQKENAICNRLYRLVSGQTENGKITLEQYIQAAGFDSIIAAANRRLLPMSDGQYELYRQEDGLGKKSNTFLDLEVLDNFTGHRRPVGNLSGGESFKASLSLALGLSDTVSRDLGGVQMDALFIDEGFGTLDRKSIENAMDILINLSGTNKLVGIISHREELMENIPQQIRIKKTKEGSTITMDRGI